MHFWIIKYESGTKNWNRSALKWFQKRVTVPKNKIISSDIFGGGTQTRCQSWDPQEKIGKIVHHMKKDGRQRGPKGPGICAASAQVRKRLWSYASQPRARTLQRGGTLVERFDIEPFSGFSAKWANFIGLVLFCIDAKFCKKIFIGKLLTRSTRFTCFCTAQTSIFQKIFVKLFRIFRQNFAKFRYFWILFTDFCSDFDEILSEFRR